MSFTPAFIPPVDTPEWFLSAIAQPRTSHFALTSDGIRIHYVCWNEQDRDKPALLFVHGYRAHTHVWDFIAPFFTEHFRVVALDLSGMGDSGWRTDYDYSIFQEDMLAVIDHAELTPVTLIGHSFGGSRLIGLAAKHPGKLKRVFLVDSMIPFPEIDEPRSTPQYGRPKPYADYASIVARYRLLPEQPAPVWSQAYMAHHSVREVEGGWSWKFDLNLPPGRIEFDTVKLLQQVTVPTDYICGARSAIVESDRVRRITDTIGQGRSAVVIPEAYHHVMLDQPLAFISALRALLI
ncbi:MAG: alpha/beta hydrolase [Spongiibacteraceae bacterium]